MMKPVISVIVTTYNHEKYISECLEGILLQKNCPEFEIVIGNDCSTDKTGEIISQYADKYPDKIVVLKRDKNLGMLQNLKDCFKNCKGEFIAICEGDDYWIDNKKLKKQYMALEKNTDALMCFSDFLCKKNTSFQKHQFRNKKCTAFDLITYKNPIGNFSCCMYRKKVLEIIPETYWNGKDDADFLFNLYVLDNSSYAVCIRENLSVYRILDNSLSHRLNKFDQTVFMINLLYRYNELFNNKYKKLLYGWINETFCVNNAKENVIQKKKRILKISFPCSLKRKLLLEISLLRKKQNAK